MPSVRRQIRRGGGRDDRLPPHHPGPHAGRRSDSTGGGIRSPGHPPLHVTHGEEGLRQATFETYEQPEPPITAMITVIDVRAEPLRTGWASCTRREFNIGYAYGCRLWVFTQGLSSQRLGRMAAADASLRITLYPPGRDKTAEPGAAADARQRSRR